MTKRRLPAGKVARLFVAGARIADLCLLFKCSHEDVVAALRRHLARVMR